MPRFGKLASEPFYRGARKQLHRAKATSYGGMVKLMAIVVVLVISGLTVGNHLHSSRCEGSHSKPRLFVGTERFVSDPMIQFT
jgi:hypothetical protein